MNKIFILLSFICNAVMAQESNTLFHFDTLILVKVIKDYNAVELHMTKTEQLFVLTAENEILKVDSAGRVILRYTNKYLGTPQFIYIENPLQLVLFYPSFQTIIILDQWMNELKRVALTDLRIPFVTTIGLSQDRSIWYFDDQVKRLKKISIDSQRSWESTILITEENADWNSMFSRNTDLIMQGKSGHLYRVNQFGQLKDKSYVDGKLFANTKDKFLALNREKKQIFLLDPKTLSIADQYSLPEKFDTTVSLQFQGDLIYQVDLNGTLKIWRRY